MRMLKRLLVVMVFVFSSLFIFACGAPDYSKVSIALDASDNIELLEDGEYDGMIKLDQTSFSIEASVQNASNKIDKTVECELIATDVITLNEQASNGNLFVFNINNNSAGGTVDIKFHLKEKGSVSTSFSLNVYKPITELSFASDVVYIERGDSIDFSQKNIFSSGWIKQNLIFNSDSTYRNLALKVEPCADLNVSAQIKNELADINAGLNASVLEVSENTVIERFKLTATAIDFMGNALLDELGSPISASTTICVLNKIDINEIVPIVARLNGRNVFQYEILNKVNNKFVLSVAKADSNINFLEDEGGVDYKTANIIFAIKKPNNITYGSTIRVGNEDYVNVFDLEAGKINAGSSVYRYVSEIVNDVVARFNYINGTINGLSKVFVLGDNSYHTNADINFQVGYSGLMNKFNNPYLTINLIVEDYPEKFQVFSTANMQKPLAENELVSVYSDYYNNEIGTPFKVNVLGPYGELKNQKFKAKIVQIKDGKELETEDFAIYLTNSSKNFNNSGELPSGSIIKIKKLTNVDLSNNYKLILTSTLYPATKFAINISILKPVNFLDEDNQVNNNLVVERYSYSTTTEYDYMFNANWITRNLSDPQIEEQTVNFDGESKTVLVDKKATFNDVGVFNYKNFNSIAVNDVSGIVSVDKGVEYIYIYDESNNILVPCGVRINTLDASGIVEVEVSLTNGAKVTLNYAKLYDIENAENISLLIGKNQIDSNSEVTLDGLVNDKQLGKLQIVLKNKDDVLVTHQFTNAFISNFLSYEILSSNYDVIDIEAKNIIKIVGYSSEDCVVSINVNYFKIEEGGSLKTETKSFTFKVKVKKLVENFVISKNNVKLVQNIKGLNLPDITFSDTLKVMPIGNYDSEISYSWFVVKTGGVYNEVKFSPDGEDSVSVFNGEGGGISVNLTKDPTTDSQISFSATWDDGIDKANCYFWIECLIDEKYKDLSGNTYHNYKSLSSYVEAEKFVGMSKIYALVANNTVEFDKREMSFQESKDSDEVVFTGNNSQIINYIINPENPHCNKLKVSSISSGDISVIIDEKTQTIRITALKYNKKIKPEYQVNISSLDGMANLTLYVRVQNGVQIPYQVSNVAELARINEDMSANYVLTNDIYATSPFMPIGYFNKDGVVEIKPFTGSLSGKYELPNNTTYFYNIEQLNLQTVAFNKNLYSGLFAELNGAVIKDLSIYNFEINARNNSVSYENIYLGAVAAKSQNSEINNCLFEDGVFGSLNGEVSNKLKNLENEKGIALKVVDSKDNVFVGGVFGLSNSDQINNSFIKVSIQIEVNELLSAPKLNVGGVIGSAQNSQIFADDSISNISYELNNYHVQSFISILNYESESVNTSIGGVIGLADDGKIINQTIRTYILAENCNNVGGAVGLAENIEIDNNVVSPFIFAKSNIGGVAGSLENNSVITSTKVQFIISNENYSIYNSSLIGWNNLGGLVGQSNGVCEYKYSSVYSYITQDLSDVDSRFGFENKEGLYFGDIVLIGTDSNKYSGGLVGNADEHIKQLSSLYVKLNISTDNGENAQALVGNKKSYEDGCEYTYANVKINNIENVIETSSTEEQKIHYDYLDYVSKILPGNEYFAYENGLTELKLVRNGKTFKYDGKSIYAYEGTNLIATTSIPSNASLEYSVTIAGESIKISDFNYFNAQNWYVIKYMDSGEEKTILVPVDANPIKKWKN